MFGLEGNKEVDNPFDLERDMKNPAKQKELMAKIEAKIQLVKNISREGVKEEDLKGLTMMLNAYMSLLRVLAKIIAK